MQNACVSPKCKILVSYCHTAVLSEPMYKLYIYKNSAVYLSHVRVTFFCKVQELRNPNIWYCYILMEYLVISDKHSPAFGYHFRFTGRLIPAVMIDCDKRAVTVLIRLCRCAGWSGFATRTFPKTVFSWRGLKLMFVIYYIYYFIHDDMGLADWEKTRNCSH